MLTSNFYFHRYNNNCFNDPKFNWQFCLKRKPQKVLKQERKFVIVLYNFFCTTFLCVITGWPSAEILGAPSSCLRCYKQTWKKVRRNRNWIWQELLWSTYSMERGTFIHFKPNLFKKSIYLLFCLFWYFSELIQELKRFMKSDLFKEKKENRWQQCKEEINVQC